METLINNAEKALEESYKLRDEMLRKIEELDNRKIELPQFIN